MRIARNLAAQILAIAVLLASTQAQAEDFRVQARLAYDKIDLDDVPDDADIWSATGTFYFKPVPTDGVPVGEAAYIARSSYVDVQGSSVEIGGEDADAIAANVGIHFTNTIFFARVGVVQTDISGDDDTSWNGTLGIVPVPRLFFGTDFTEDDWDPNLTARYVGKLANDHWYGASITLSDPDDDDTNVGLEFDYYFTGFKLGASFGSGTDLVGVRAEVGLPHGFALLGRVYSDDVGDGIGLQLTWRDL
jgi:hypothetical protein